MLKLVYIILIALSFSCQFKAEEEGGDLVAGHKEVTNSFTVSVPSAGIRNEGDVLTFVLTHPYNVTVTNVPRLTLTIGGATVYADYASGDGTKNIVFTYEILAGQTDTDGITVASTIDLNGGTLTYTGTQGTANCPTSISVPSTSSIRVDTTAPTVSIVAPPANATYYVSQSMLFTVTMSEATTITGTPRLTLNVGGTTRYATYLSGSGSTTLLFNYVVQAADLDTNGIGVTTAIDADGGTLRDAAGNDATLTFAAINTTNVDANGGVPYVTSVTPPANGSYGVGDNLDFVFTYSEPVNVTGIPTVTLTIGATGRLASYYSGSGSTQLTFRYVITAGEVDSNGIASAAVFGMGGATIRDAAVTNAINGFVMPSLTAVLVVDDRPVISSFLYTNATTYIGGTLTFTALFNEAVTITGTPRIPLTLNTGGPVYANYVSGSGTTNIVFSYTVAEGTDDNNGIVITTPVDLNSGTIKNASGADANLAFTQPSTGNVRISGIRPVINSITPIADGSYITGQALTFAVVFSETVTANSTANVDLILDIGGVARTANYVSGSGTTTLNFSYTIVGGDTDIDGISITSLTLLAAASITDSGTVGNTATLTLPVTNTAGILVNATTPSISTITSPLDGDYILSENMDFLLNYSEAVTVTGTPRLALTVGGSTLYATYQAGSGTASLTFRYTVGAGHLDADGISAALVVDNNGGTINSALGVPATTTAPAQVLTGVLVDGVVPAVDTVTNPANATYTLASTSMDFTVEWDDIVQVTGAPQIVLTVGTQTRYAVYSGGDGTTTLTFTYTIDPVDIDLDGIELANSNNIDLAGGTLQDNYGNTVELGIGAQNLSGIKINFAGLQAWWDITDAATLSTGVCGAAFCINQINDKSGNNKHATAAGAARPEYVSAGFGGENLAAMQFDNTGMVMGSPGISPTRTIFVVFRTEVSAMTDQDIFQQNAAARIRVQAGGTINFGTVASYLMNGSGLFTGASTYAAGIVPNSEYIVGLRFNSDLNFSTPIIGSTIFGGSIAEILVYSTALTAAEMAAVDAYLNLKYDIY